MLPPIEGFSMIKLDLKREPHWLDLGHGVRLHVKPCTSAIMLAARSAAAREGLVDPEKDAPLTPEEIIGARASSFMKALARLVIIGWEGVGDADNQPALLSPEGIDALLDLWPIADAFERQYLGPALLLAQEKNA
jgi:hypothetical protein